MFSAPQAGLHIPKKPKAGLCAALVQVWHAAAPQGLVDNTRGMADAGVLQVLTWALGRQLVSWSRHANYRLQLEAGFKSPLPDHTGCARLAHTAVRSCSPSLSSTPCAALQVPIQFSSSTPPSVGLPQHLCIHVLAVSQVALCSPMIERGVLQHGCGPTAGLFVMMATVQVSAHGPAHWPTVCCSALLGSELRPILRPVKWSGDMIACLLQQGPAPLCNHCRLRQLG
jgi:hypothetical protein